MNVYFISGLGADRRIFSNINLRPNLKIIHVNWIAFGKKKSLEKYAARLSLQIDTSISFALVGVSFGGMIAVELAKLLKPSATVIISSSVKRTELPLTYRLACLPSVLSIIPTGLLKFWNKFTQNYFFGVTTKEDKQLLAKIIEDTDPSFLKPAIKSILTWKNKIRPKDLIQIHGSKDRILYSKNASPNYIIQNGTHFMVYQNASEISEILNKHLL